jgi:predicted nucleotide-binding protein (sugar kinase/HSP70/actin superfamily)
LKLFYIELKYKNKVDILGEFLVKSEDEITAIKDVIQNIKEINPSIVNSVVPNFDISLEDLSEFYSYDQLKTDITSGRQVVEHTEKITEIKEFTDKNLLN